MKTNLEFAFNKKTLAALVSALMLSFPASADFFYVVNTSDSGVGSLRQAIVDANARLGLDFIFFNIPGAGLHTIRPLSPLPRITDAVVIDGYSQSDASQNTLGDGNNAVLRIELDGSAAGVGANGLHMRSSGSIVRGLVINRFLGDGILIEGLANNFVTGNFIGTDATGTVIRGNGRTDIGSTIGAGVRILNSVNNTIGGTSAGSRNVITGNVSDGISIENALSSRNKIQGNFIGTDRTGRLPLGSLAARQHNGIIISSSPRNVIGGLVSGSRNIIADGIGIVGYDAVQNVVQGNYIGVNITGRAALGSRGGTGIAIVNAHSNVIGSTLAVGRNVISGDRIGVSIAAVTVEAVREGATNNVVIGNFIGVDATGTTPLGNSDAGIVIVGGKQNVIGGTSPESANVISGNGDGIRLEPGFTNAVANRIEGNRIGVDLNGTLPLGNQKDGVLLHSPSEKVFQNVIGGFAPGAGNVISGNGSNGVHIIGPRTFENRVQGNFIGTDVTGTRQISNSWHGVLVEGAATRNIIGGSAIGMRNVISGNMLDGVSIRSAGTSANLVAGNYIGTDTSGTARIGNESAGIRIMANDHLVGGTLPSLGNVISGNAIGVFIGGHRNALEGNLIGTDRLGRFAIANGYGVILAGELQYSTGNRIGGVAAGTRNIISGNFEGVFIDGIGAATNRVEGNYIGTDRTGTRAVRNAFHGVYIRYGAHHNTIGGPMAGARNIISGNGRDGVYISDLATSNTVAGNFIGSDVSGSVALGNLGNGIWINAAGTNRIGGVGVAYRNVIVANNDSGILVSGAGARYNEVFGNYVGLNSAGLAALANGFNGITIYAGAHDNKIGGSASLRNVISGNMGAGVFLRDEGTGTNEIRGNYIGLDLAGAGPLPNSGSGVEIWGGAKGNRITDGNRIWYNNLDGVWIQPEGTTGNTISGNSIYQNDGLGINLQPVGEGPSTVTPNDAVDIDTGPNNLQNYPTITTISASVGSTTVNGLLQSAPSRSFALHFYKSAIPDPSGYGEGQTYLGLVTVMTDGGGRANFSFSTASITTGDYVAATATDILTGDTSEFSGSVGATTPPRITVGDVVAGEGSSGFTPMMFKVMLSSPSSLTTSVSVATADLTATAPADYTPIQTTLVFLPNETSKNVIVQVKADLLHESDEQFRLLLTGAQNAGIATPEAIGTIIDDDEPKFVTVSGTVSDANQKGMADAAVLVSGTTQLSAVTDTKGGFIISNIMYGGDYQIAAFKSGFSFEPSVYTFLNITTSIAANFTASQQWTNPPTLVMADAPSGMELRLDRLFYRAGLGVSATLDLGGFRSDALVAQVLLVGPQSGDVELLTLKRNGPEMVYTNDPVPIVAMDPNNPVNKLDGFLALNPNEMFHAIWYVQDLQSDGPLPQEQMVTDFGIMEDPQFSQAPFQVLPQLAMTDDETQVPPGGKLIGTILRHGELPVQVPINELILIPSSQKQLNRFLAETSGKILRTDVLPEAANERQPTSYLIKVDPAQADMQHLSQMRALYTDMKPLLGSKEEVLRIYALALHYKMEGYSVGVNPRLQFMAAPRGSDIERANTTRTVKLELPILNVPQVWAFMALWEKDEQQIPVAFLDMGFAPNPDYRRPPGGTLVECDLEGASLVEGLLTGFRCEPGIAEGPPTVGASFFGPKIWHGNGVVTVAGGVLNNNWGSAGVGGQVVVPMLYRFGLASYAFEMGLGIEKAARDGASVINLSSGYPCTIVSTVGIGVAICGAEERAAFCAAVTASLAAAAAVICASIPLLAAIPFVGPALAAAAAVACAVATAVTVAASTACFATVLEGDVREPMRRGIEFATSRGVPVVTVAGNRISRDALPAIIADFIDTDDLRVERWNIHPAMIADCIVVGSVTNDFPYENQDFFGDRVDLWAPIDSGYMHPPTTDSVGGVQVSNLQFNGTSAAVPWISGLIACMQAVDPSLNPNTPGLSATERALIPGRIKDLLVSSAWTAAELVTAAGDAGMDATATSDAGSRRRNVANAFRTILNTAAGVIPDFGALGYDTQMNFDETSPPVSADDFANARILSRTELTGTILAMRGEAGGSSYTDADFFRYHIEPASPGVYRARVLLKVPSGFGALSIDRRPAAERSDISAVEEQFVFNGPELFNGAADFFSIRGEGLIDNVYKVVIDSFERTGDLPRPDRFDLDDPAINPPESRPRNDNFAHGVHLGGTNEFAWQPGGRDAFGSYMQITIPDLNFDWTLDEDWFKVIGLPPYTVGETPGCQPILEIRFAEGMRLELYGSDERLILRDSSSPATITADFLAPLPIAFKLVPEVPGRALDYTLELRFRQTDAELCEWAESHADGRHLGRMRGSGLIGFPAYFPDVPSFGPGEYPPLKERIADTLQRVINPDVYMINWRQSGAFTATIELLQGTSIRVRLMSSQGQVMAEAATDDLPGNIGGQAPLSPHAMVTDNPKPVSPRQILFLVNSQLAAGNYLLEVSLGRPNTVLLVTLPRGATSDGSLGVEDYTAGPQPDPPAIKLGRTPNGLLIAWPDKGFRFLLEEKMGLGLNASWQPSQKKPVVIDGQNAVGLSPTDPQNFFRLRYAP